MTAEDPVEFTFGINQVQMKEQIGLNFAAALRSFYVRIPTSFWSAKSVISRPPKIAIRPRSQVTLSLDAAHNDAPSRFASLNRVSNLPVATS